MPNPCKNCETTCWSGYGEYELCTKCMIGDQSPSIWVLSQIKEGILNFKGSSYQLKTRSSDRSLTYNINTGECIGREKPNIGESKDFVTIMVSVYCDNQEGFPNTRIKFRTWKDAGTSSLGEEGPYQISSFDKLVEEGAPLFVATLFKLIKFAKEDLYICASCEKECKNPPAGRYFAGTYCGPCWERYKNKNSRTCSICRRPMYQCYC